MRISTRRWCHDDSYNWISPGVLGGGGRVPSSFTVFDLRPLFWFQLPVLHICAAIVPMYI